jgi:membrane protein
MAAVQRSEPTTDHAAMDHAADEGSLGGAVSWAADMRERLTRFHASQQREHAAYALLVAIVQAIQRHRPANLAKQAAYSLLYAVPSIMIVLVSLAAIIDKNTGAGVSEWLQTFIAEQAPEELQPLLSALVQNAIVETSEQAAIVATIVSLTVAVWGGAGGVGALVHAINAVYDIRDTRPFFKSTGLNLGLMLLDGVLVVGSFFLLVFGRRLGEWLVDIVGYGTTLVNLLLSGPVWALFMLVAALLLLYWLAPNISQSFLWILPGTAVATLGIVVVFALLDFILSISNPGAAFGVAGSVLILLWLLFVVSAIVVVGGIVNAVVGRRHDRKLKAQLRQHPEKRLDRPQIAISEYH